MNPKEVAGTWAANLVEPGMKVGLGTGSTAYFVIMRLGQRVAEGLEIVATATSKATELLATEQHIPLLPLEQIGRLDIAIDGADEIDPHLHLIKGGGGALFREKMVAMQARRFVIVGDPSKYVDTLGAFPLPVEVVPFAHELTRSKLESLQAHPKLRLDDKGQPYLTDNGNYIYDCHVQRIPDPADFHSTLKSITGVVDTGLFIGLADQAVIGREDGTLTFLNR
ncbi:MAG: ribose-5-phosphate isomerase RpiA [Bacteroidia bacterium]|nr:ribose-5-phosphate isomerase RpiA [Bacteroidia bacterium]